MIQRNSYYLSEKIIALSSIMLQNDTKLYKIEDKNDAKKKKKQNKKILCQLTTKFKLKCLKSDSKLPKRLLLFALMKSL